MRDPQTPLKSGTIARAATLVSAGSLTLVVMATLVKHLGPCF